MRRPSLSEFLTFGQPATFITILSVTGVPLLISQVLIGTIKPGEFIRQHQNSVYVLGFGVATNVVSALLLRHVCKKSYSPFLNHRLSWIIPLLFYHTFSAILISLANLLIQWGHSGTPQILSTYEWFLGYSIISSFTLIMIATFYNQGIKSEYNRRNELATACSNWLDTIHKLKNSPDASTFDRENSGKEFKDNTYKIREILNESNLSDEVDLYQDFDTIWSETNHISIMSLEQKLSDESIDGVERVKCEIKYLK